MALPVWAARHRGHPSVYPYLSKSSLSMAKLLRVGSLLKLGVPGIAAGGMYTLVLMRRLLTPGLGSQGVPLMFLMRSAFHLSCEFVIGLKVLALVMPVGSPIMASLLVPQTPGHTPRFQRFSNLTPLTSQHSRKYTVSPNSASF